MLNGLLAVLLLIASPASLWAADDVDGRRAAAVSAADEIITMRSSRARAFVRPGTVITEETFKSVCGAVFARVKEIAEARRLKIRHAAVRYRNPRNEARPDERAALEMFDRDRELLEKWDIVEVDGQRHQRYMRPIFVEEACLACHGPRDGRPVFIVERYPSDRAFDFKTGDLRGLIEITIPD